MDIPITVGISKKAGIYEVRIAGSCVATFVDRTGAYSYYVGVMRGINTMEGTVHALDLVDEDA